MLGTFLDLLGTKSVRTDSPWLEATIRPADEVRSRWGQRSDAQQLVDRAKQLILTYATMNVRTCSGCCLRLYRKTSGKNTAGKHKWARPVTDRKTLRYLRDTKHGPGRKAAQYAEYAGDFEEVMEHPALDLIRRPNPWMLGSTFPLTNYMSWELTGRRFIHHVDGPGGVPKMLLPMLPQWTRVIPSRDAFIGGFVYGKDGMIEDVFDADEVYYQRLMPSPFDPTDAIGPLHSVFLEADVYAAATQNELATWHNGARPDWAIGVPPETTQPQIDQLRAQINKDHRGVQNRGKFLITALTEIKALQFTPKEMEYLLGKQDLRKTIRSAFGIPESMDEMNDANLASSLTGNMQYMRHTIAPRVNQDAEEWTETVLPHFADPGEYWFAYDNPVPEDRASMREDIKVFVQGPKPIWSVNEGRQEADYDAIEDESADSLDAPLTGIASPMMSEDGETTDPNADPDDQAKPAAEGAGIETALSLTGIDAERAGVLCQQVSKGEQDPTVVELLLTAMGISPEVASQMVTAAAAFTPEPSAEEVAAQTAAENPAPVTNAKPPAKRGCGHSHKGKPKSLAAEWGTKGLTSDEDKLRAAVAKVFADLEAVILPMAVTTSNAAQAVEASGFIQKLADAVMPHVNAQLEAGYNVGVSQVANQGAIIDPFDLADSRAINFSQGYRMRLAGGVSKTVTERLQTVITEGLASGRSSVDTVAALRTEYGVLSASRADTIARSEYARASTMGRIEAWKNSGIVVGKEWQLSGNPCPLCEALAAQYGVKELDAPFLKLGDTITDAGGQQYTMDYGTVEGGGLEGPPGHPNCACSIAPVFQKGDA